MNDDAFLRYAYEEAALATKGRKAVLVTLRCGLAEGECRHAVVGTVYATRVGILLVSLVSTRATAASHPGRRAMAVGSADAVPRYWLLSSTGATAMSHPSPLTTTSPPSLVRAGDRPIRLHCNIDREWIECAYTTILDPALKAKNTRKPITLMVA